MVAGRPLKYSKEDLKAKLIEWIQLEDSDNINGFCVYAWIPYGTLSGYVAEDKEFSETYDLVKSVIAIRREQKANMKLMAPNVYALNARSYDRNLKEDWKEEMKFLSGLKREEAANISAETACKFDGLMNQLKKIQSDVSSTSLSNLNSDSPSS